MENAPSDKLRILVTDGGSVNALSIVRHLGERGYDIYVVAYNKLALSFYSRFCAKAFRISHPKNNPEKFSSELLRIIAAEKIDFLMPVGFYAHKAVIERQHLFDALIKTQLPSQQSFEVATSKVATSLLAETAGVRVPKTKLISDLNTLNSVDDLIYPVVIKSQKEIGGRMVEYAGNKEEMISRFNALVVKHKLLGADYPIIQEYIEGAGVGFFAFYNQGNLVSSFMHERVREFPVTGGRSVCARSFYDEKLANAGKAVLDALKWNGCAMVEFKRTKENEYYLLEVNPKLWGSLELAIVAGVNFPEQMVLHSPGNPVTPGIGYTTDLHFQWLLNGELYHAANRPASIGSIFSTMRRSKKDFWFRDIKPNLMQVLLVFIDLYKAIKARS